MSTTENFTEGGHLPQAAGDEDNISVDAYDWDKMAEESEMIPDIPRIAAHFIGITNGYFNEKHTDIFLVAVALVLGDAKVSDWKDLASSSSASEETTDPSETASYSGSAVSKRKGSKGGVSFAIIGRKMNEIFEEKKLPKESMVNLERYRDDRPGICAYFCQKLKKNYRKLKDQMEKFAIALSGYICKLYFSKEGYDATFEQLSSAVGSYIAQNGIVASKTLNEFQFRLVLPAELGYLYSQEAVLDNSQDLLRPHCIRDDSSDMETLRPEPHATGSGQRSTKPARCVIPKSYADRIKENDTKIMRLEHDIGRLNLQIGDMNKEISELQLENLNLKKLEEQQRNNEDLVKKLRVVANDEVAFKGISDVVTGVVPSLAELVLKVEHSKITHVIMKALESLTEPTPVEKGSFMELGNQQIDSPFEDEAVASGAEKGSAESEGDPDKCVNNEPNATSSGKYTGVSLSSIPAGESNLEERSAPLGNVITVPQSVESPETPAPADSQSDKQAYSSQDCLPADESSNKRIDATEVRAGQGPSENTQLPKRSASRSKKNTAGEGQGDETSGKTGKEPTKKKSQARKKKADASPEKSSSAEGETFLAPLPKKTRR